LGTIETGGCGEDWWHPGCVVGLTADWREAPEHKKVSETSKNEGLLETITEVAEASVEQRNAEAHETNGNVEISATDNGAPVEQEVEDDDLPPPPGFPHEDDFDGFICYKCVDAFPWIKRYADTPGFLPAVFKRSAAPSPEIGLLEKVTDVLTEPFVTGKKRKAEEEDVSADSTAQEKRQKGETPISSSEPSVAPVEEALSKPEACKASSLPSPPSGQFSLFLKPDFREHFCRCKECFPLLAPHPQLLEEEDTYEPPLSEGSQGEDGGSTVGSGSIYDRGESALKNVDRVRAIEGVMAYNHLKEKLIPFFKQHAESGKAISAEDIKAHFAKMRGDEQAIKDAAAGAKM